MQTALKTSQQMICVNFSRFIFSLESVICIQASWKKNTKWIHACWDAFSFAGGKDCTAPLGKFMFIQIPYYPWTENDKGLICAGNLTADGTEICSGDKQIHRSEIVFCLYNEHLVIFNIHVVMSYHVPKNLFLLVTQ